jgi:hypothetical protein
MLTPIPLDMCISEFKLFLVTVTVSGAPVPLDGCVLIWTLKKNPNTPDPGLIQKRSDTAPPGIAITDSANGAATLTLNPADTKSMAAYAHYQWDMRLIANGEPYTIAAGTLQLLQNVTDAIA